MDAIQICRGYVEAQEEYASEVHDESGINQYAQRIISTPGKHDGLAWRNPDGSACGPVGEEVAKAIEEGYTNKAAFKVQRARDLRRHSASSIIRSRE